MGDRWLDRELDRLGAAADETPDAGLLQSMAALRSPVLHPDRLDPAVVDFYERTAAWRLELWSQWCPPFQVAGRLLSSLFARRLEQLDLPLSPMEVSRGMTSRVVRGRRRDGTIVGAAWIRTLRLSGRAVYGGWYGTVTLPRRQVPSIRVVFPLPEGHLTVLLRPESRPGGQLRLVSPAGGFGDEGAYLFVRNADGTGGWARRIPITETFDVYVDEEQVLRCDHELRFGRLRMLRLHYRLTPDDAATGA